MSSLKNRVALIFRTETEIAEAKLRERHTRWSAKARSRVEHPAHGAVIVPHASSYSAICCAAEVWGCDTMEVMDAAVTLVPQDAPIGVAG